MGRVVLKIGNVYLKHNGIMTSFDIIKLTRKKINNKHKYTIIIPIPDELKNHTPYDYRKKEYKKFIPNKFKYEIDSDSYYKYEFFRYVIDSDKDAEKIQKILKNGLSHEFLTYNSSTYRNLKLEIELIKDFDEAIAEFVAKKI